MFEHALKRQIASTSKLICDHGYSVATSGNVSARSGEKIFITPRGVRKDSIEPKHIVECSLDGKTLGCGTPSTELFTHMLVYQRRPDVLAAIHAHPPYSVLCSIAQLSPTDLDLPEIRVHLGSAAMVPKAKPGTKDMADKLEPFIKDHNTFLLTEHGVLVLAKDLSEAFTRLQYLEYASKITWKLKNRQK